MHSIIRDMNFKEIAETKPDSKHRVTLGSIPLKAHHFKIYVNEVGQIILDPQMSIPASEIWLFKNKKALASVVRGLADAKAGRLKKAPEDYSHYIEDDK